MLALKTLAFFRSFRCTSRRAHPSHQPHQRRFPCKLEQHPYCPYGYYDYAPYSCSPYGYYGPDWFNGGVFIGAGPWFHGRTRLLWPRR